MEKKSFVAGLITGHAVALLAVAAAAVCVKIKVIDPYERKEQMIAEGRKRAPRKRIAP